MNALAPDFDFTDAANPEAFINIPVTGDEFIVDDFGDAAGLDPMRGDTLVVLGPPREYYIFDGVNWVLIDPSAAGRADISPLALAAGTGVFAPPDFSGPTVDGAIAADFLADWYFRYHFIPGSLNLGNVVTAQSRDVLLWNAFLTPQEIQDFGITASEGLGAVSPTSVPYTMQPLELLTYTVQAAAQGAPQINASLVWVIEGQTFNVPIIGQRIVVWPFSPTWQNGLAESLEWRSTVIRAFNGKEQRTALRRTPRQTIEYTSLMTGLEAQTFENIMFGWQYRQFALPLWQEKSRLTEGVPGGLDVLQLQTEGRRIKPGSLLVIFADFQNFETVEVETVGPNSVVLRAAVQRDWPEGTPVFPVTIANLANEIPTQRATDATMTARVRFAVDPSFDDAAIPVETGLPVYRGIELYVGNRPNWAQQIDFIYRADVDLIDFGTSRYRTRARNSTPYHEKRTNWQVTSRQAIAQLRAFLGRRQGRAVPVWMPSGNIDFKLLDNITAVALVIDVMPNDYDRLVGQAPNKRDILIELRDGAVFARRIVSSTLGASGELRLGIDAALGQNVSIAQVKRISYLGLYRLTGDAVTFNYLSQTTATVAAGITATLE